MVRTVRKKRSFEQKQKRPNAHQVGKQIQASSNKESCELYPFLKTQMLLKTNKEYRIAEFQRVIGGLLVMGALIYILGSCVCYFSIKFVNSISLGLLKSSPFLEQFHSLTFWEFYERYSMGQPIVVGIIILLLVTGVVLSSEGKKNRIGLELIPTMTN